jgi:hypothetical protein
MIKKLFFVAALLMPSLACGGDPTANLPVQIVPAGPDPGIVCDTGPNYSGSVPAPAAAAGFTHCALNADFTTSAYSNPATWLAECGASPNSQNTLFHLRMANQSNSTITDAPCNRAVMKTDGGVQVLDLAFHPSDYTVSGNTYMALNWPADEWGAGPCGSFSCRGGPNGGAGLWQQMYSEITYRMLPSSWNTTPPHANGQVVDWWIDGCQSCPKLGTGGGLEIDFFEITANNYNSGAQTAQYDPGFHGSSLPSYTLDTSGYHTIGSLITSDGTTTGYCVYVDGGIATRTPVSCGSRNESNGQASIAGLSMWLAGALCRVSDPNAPAGCQTDTIEAYVKSIRLWECSNYWGAACYGPIITGSLERPNVFSWAFAAVKSWLLPSAYAYDVFDAPAQGMWVCPDGTKHISTPCQPPEFRAGEWWKACIPERTDCVHSDTAFIGWEQTPFGRLGQRGPGYCYTQQPYTCAPDGKWPQ